MPDSARKKPLILVVDDEPEIRKLLRTFLEHEGYAVEEASSGATGLTKAMVERPDVMVLDQRLPDFDGIEIHLHLSQMGVVIPTIMMSNHPGVDEMRLLHRIRHYIPKPLSFDELSKAIRELLA